MILRILGWQSKGMRCPDAKVTLATRNKVDLFLMNNGTGKTTTLNLIQMALTGEKDIGVITADLNGEDIRSQPFELLHMDNMDRGTFTLDLLINRKEYSITISIDRKENIVNIRTSSPEIGGDQAGWRPPNEAKPFLNLDFVKLFVFDGEKAARLFKKGKGAKKAIDLLCQFHILDQGQKNITTYLDERKTQEGIGAGTDGAVTKIGNLLTTYVTHLQNVNDDYKAEKKDLKKNEAKHKEIDDRIQEEINRNKKLNEAKKTITDAIKDVKDEIKDTQKNILQTLTNPMNISKNLRNDLLTFKDNLNLLRLPDDVAKEFFNELSKQPKCVCNRDIGPKEKECILTNAQDFLDDNTSGVLNQIKGAVDSHKDNELLLEELLKQLIEKDKKQQEEQTALNTLIASHGEENEEFKADYKNLGLLEKAIEDNKLIIQSYEEKGDPELLQRHPTQKDGIEQIENIKTLENIITKLKDKKDRVSNTRNLRRASKIFTEIMKATQAIASDDIYEGIKEKAQEQVNKILVNAKPPIVIDSVNDYVKIQGREDMSEGQKLSTAYVFMLAAMSYSNVEVPFIVDSPTGKLDSGVRKEVAKAIPKLSNQFISFVTDTETIAFLKFLNDEVEPLSSYTTIFWKSEEVDKWLAKNKISSKDIELYDDWGLVRGYEHMKNYQLS